MPVESQGRVRSSMSTTNGVAGVELASPVTGVNSVEHPTVAVVVESPVVQHDLPSIDEHKELFSPAASSAIHHPAPNPSAVSAGKGSGAGAGGVDEEDVRSSAPPYYRNQSSLLLLSRDGQYTAFPQQQQPPGVLSEDEEGRIALLLSAASKDNADRVLSLLRSGLDASSCNEDRRTALHVAASDGSINVVQCLIEEGCDINAKDRFGHTPLDDSIQGGHKQVTDLLRYYHAQHGSIEKLEAKLIQACADNNLAEVATLLDAGVNPNCADYDARTPLHLAVAEGNVEICKLLLEKGADPKAEDRWGSSPLSELQRRLARTGRDPMQEVFVDYMETATPTLLSPFLLLFCGWEFVMIVLLGIFARYGSDSDGNINPATGQPVFDAHYPLYMDVHVMIFIGFGYLMVFLRKNGYTAVGVTFLLGGVGDPVVSTDAWLLGRRVRQHVGQDSAHPSLPSSRRTSVRALCSSRSGWCWAR